MLDRRPADGVTRATRATRVGLVAGAAGPILTWALSILVIASWPGYDPVRQSVSLLATAPLGWLMSISFALSGILGAAWAIGLSAVLGASARHRAIVRWLLLLQALIAFGFAILPTDPTGTPVSLVGSLHLADFYAYALTMPLTLLALGLVIRLDPAWSAAGATRPTFLAAALALASIALVPATIDGPLTPWLGLLERVFIAIPSVWQVYAALVAWRLVPSRAAVASATADAVAVDTPDGVTSGGVTA